MKIKVKSNMSTYLLRREFGSVENFDARKGNVARNKEISEILEEIN